MLFKIFRTFFVVSVLLSSSAFGQNQSTGVDLDQDYQITDYTPQAEILLKRFDLLNQRLTRMKQERAVSDDVDDLIAKLYLPRTTKDFQRIYREEFRVLQTSKDAGRWKVLAAKYYKDGNFNDAVVAANMAYKYASSNREKASTLVTMAEALLSDNQYYDAINLLNQSNMLHRNGNTQSRISVIQERFFLYIRDIAINSEQQSPNACINFNKALDKKQNPEDYVSVADLDDVDISLKDTQICLNGLQFGERYSVQIKNGLKSSDGVKLAQDTTREFRIDDRESRVTFERGSYVISRTEDNTVPLSTVNIEKLELKLYLIHDRNLVSGTEQNLFQNLNAYYENNISSNFGSLVWEGEVDIEHDKNAEVKTLIPVSEIIEEKENGIYILVANEPLKEGENPNRSYRNIKATQWLLVSDMGLMTFRGKDGLNVMVRSLEKATPIDGVVVKLIARNNKILATANSDENGVAHFPVGLMRGTGGDAPILITAEGKQEDYNFLKFQNSYLDLGERGVSGRLAPGKQDAFLYTDRGVYRPGETVKLSAILRDAKSKAIGGLPVTFKISKPDGSVLIEEMITGNKLGGYSLDVPISSGAIPGRYTATIFLTEVTISLGRVNFQVEDFVPERIRARLTTDEPWLEAEKETEVKLKANFLYGPPATGLKTESRIILNRDAAPFEDYKDFRFGLIEENFFNKTLTPATFTTNEQGEALIPVNIDDIPDTTQPLLAYIHSSVFDVSGRPVNAGLALPVRVRDVEVGLKKAFEGSLNAGETASYEVVAVNKQGEPVKNRTISYELVKEEYYYSWYRAGAYWNSRQNITETMQETGEVKTDENGIAKIDFTVADGRYRLNVIDHEGMSAASDRYYVGWWSRSTMPNVPDELELSVKETALRDGDILNAFVKAPFAGVATIMIMNDELHLTREIEIPEEGSEISIQVDKDWGVGAYLMVTAFRPEAGEISKLPVRSMGLQWFSIDKDRRTIDVKIDTPEKVEPRQEITIPISVADEKAANKKIHLTLAAVDEGILSLTDFKSPSPEDYFLSQRRLGISIADLYGRLIKPVNGVRGQIRSGGDLMSVVGSRVRGRTASMDEKADENATGVQTKTVKTVALYERDIVLDENGNAEVTLDIPDFNGRLRLMFVAYGEDVIGHGDRELIVRDPVVADFLLPRFLSPGDKAETTISVHNLSDEDRTFSVNVDHTDGLVFNGDKTMNITLANGERFEKVITMTAQDIGDSNVSINVKSDGLKDINRNWDIAVRPAQPFITKRQVAYLAEGDSDDIEREDIAEFLESTVSTSLTLTNKPDYNVPELLDGLYYYPYACGEQTTSRALPLLYYADVMKTWKKDYDPLTLRRRIDQSIYRLLDLQKNDGSFAVWRSNGRVHHWLSAYIFEFLSRAKEQDYNVPTAAYDHARSWLNSTLNNRRQQSPHVAAYIMYVLTRIGDVQPSEVRYFADTRGKSIETRAGLAHLAASLKLVGEDEMAEEYFILAMKKERPRGQYWRWYHDYGSDMRDSSIVALLIAESYPDGTRQLQIAETLSREYDRRKYFSTQEKAWLLLANHTMTKHHGDGFQVALNQEEEQVSREPLRYQLESDVVLTGINVENISSSPIRSIQSYRGVPAQNLPAVANGFEISREFLTLDGEPADLNNIKQNDLIIVSIRGEIKNQIDHEALIVDLLPAGFEIENAAIGGYQGQNAPKFLPRKTYFQYEAARDDRYVAAMDINWRTRKFATSYIVRAVTPGDYKIPAIFVEDMYKPQYHARGTVGSLKISK